MEDPKKISELNQLAITLTNLPSDNFFVPVTRHHNNERINEKVNLREVLQNILNKIANEVENVQEEQSESGASQSQITNLQNQINSLTARVDAMDGGAQIANYPIHRISVTDGTTNLVYDLPTGPNAMSQSIVIPVPTITQPKAQIVLTISDIIMTSNATKASFSISVTTNREASQTIGVINVAGYCRNGSSMQSTVVQMDIESYQGQGQTVNVSKNSSVILQGVMTCSMVASTGQSMWVDMSLSIGSTSLGITASASGNGTSTNTGSASIYLYDS